MENLPVDLAYAPPNRGREELALTPQFLLAQRVRYRYLAVRARGEANAVSGDPIALRLIELAEKLEGDAVCDEAEARILLAEQDKAPQFRQHDRDAGASGRSFEGPRQAAGGEQP